MSYAYQLADYLGEDWKIYNGGHGGDTTPEILFRQGCIRAKFNTSYTLTYPNATTGLGSSSVILESCTAIDGVTSYFNASKFSESDWSLFNPCTISGIKCNVNRNSVTPLESCDGVPGDWISTYGSTISPNVDVNSYYIGRNGGYKNTDQLILQYQKMVDYGSSNYIVLGFHEPISYLKTIRNVDDTYLTKMNSTFGSHFMDLNKEIRLRAAELLYLTGINTSISEYYDSQTDAAKADRQYVSEGKIPKSFFISDLFHCNSNGCDAIAILVHDKMVKLGYLTDSYILSTGSDL